MFKSFINHNKQQSKKSIKNLHDDPRTNVFHITDEFFCSGCYATIEKEKINSKTNNTFINNEEEIDYWNIDYNPDMEEETKCLYCFKSSYPASATCLIEGQPACTECAFNIKNRPTYSTEPVELDQISRLFLDNPILSASTMNERSAKNAKKQKDKENSLSKSRSNNSSAILNTDLSIKKEKDIEKSLIIEKENLPQQELPTNRRLSIRKLTFKDVRSSINFTNPIESNYATTGEIQNIPKEIEKTHNPAKSRMLPKVSLNLSELTPKDFDNKIMNLVSPRTSIEFKYKRLNQGNRQFDQLCKSLDVIFNVQPGIKFSISLPVVFQGPKFSKLENNLVDALNKNGNYLFYLTDANSEFMFGLLWVTSDSKKMIKFFRNSSQKSIKSKIDFNLIYDDEIYDDIIIKNNLIISENDFSFSLTNYKFDMDNLKVSRFICNSFKKISIETVSDLTVYDMC